MSPTTALCSNHFTEPRDRARVLSGGCTGLIEACTCGLHVRKILHSHEDEVGNKLKDLATEAEVYERTAPHRHPNLLRLVESDPNHGIVLPYISGTDARSYLRDNPQTSTAQRITWAAQAASALHCLHNCGVVHSDLNPTNLLVDQVKDNTVYLIDFSGSTVDGVVGSGLEGVRFCLPGTETPCVRSDLLAFGSTLYELMAGCHPYADLSDDEVEASFLRGRFPDTELYRGGQVMMKCWQERYDTAEEVERDLQQVLRA